MADGSLHTQVSVHLTAPVNASGEVAVSVALAGTVVAAEALSITDDAGNELPWRQVDMPHSTRIQVVAAREGALHVRYDAASRATAPQRHAVTEADRLLYLRPSKYCPNDRLAGLAVAEFGRYDGQAATVQALTDWINYTVSYLPGTTDAADDALHPLLAREGICRDFAHLGVTFCRALGIPARYVSVYAPGLSPMDMHAVFEAGIDGYWHLFDATRLAPRAAMVRIATGRDAADTAILSPLGAWLEAPELTVTATAEPDLPDDNSDSLVTLA